MTEREFDKLIENTLAEYGDGFYTEPDAPEHRFTPEFDRRVMAAAKGGKKKKGQLLRIFTGIGAVAAAVVIGVIAVNVLQSGFGNVPVANNQAATVSGHASADDPAEGSEVSSDDKLLQDETPDNKGYGVTSNSQSKSLDKIADNKSVDMANAAENAFVPDNEPENLSDGMNEESGTAVDEPDSQDAPAAEEPAPSIKNGGTAAALSDNVTVVRNGVELSLADEQLEEIAAMLRDLTADSDNIVDNALTDEETERFMNEGYLITVITGKGAIVNGEMIPDARLTLMVTEAEGFVTVQGESLNVCYCVPDPMQTVNELDRITA